MQHKCSADPLLAAVRLHPTAPSCRQDGAVGCKRTAASKGSALHLCCMALLDQIGPVMVGPSSSHTAGACRLALLARHCLLIEPRRVRFVLHGSFAKTARG